MHAFKYLLHNTVIELIIREADTRINVVISVYNQKDEMPLSGGDLVFFDKH